MESQQLIQEDEIDLREYIKIIIKRKKLILSFFCIAVVVAAALSSFFPKVYKATATIMISPSTMQNVLSPSKGLLDVEKNGATAFPWSETMATHITLLKANLVLERTIQKLNLKDRSGKSMTVDGLSSKLNIKQSNEENILQLEAVDVDPQEAKNIANAWSQQYVEYSQDLILGEVNGIGNFVTTQFEISKKDLFDAEEKVNNFKKEYRQDLMRADLAMKKAMLNSYKKEFAGLGRSIEVQEDTLLELKKQIAAQKEVIIISKADDLSGPDQKGVSSEIINPIYQNLETRIVNGEIMVNTLKASEEFLKNSIGSLTEETKQLDDDIFQKDFDLDQLEGQANVFKKSYYVFLNRMEDVRIIQAAQLKDVKIASPASTPDYPVGQGKVKIVALTGIFSLILGMFFAFFMEFWQKGAQREGK